MKELEIVFRNFSTDCWEERMENVLKNFFWHEGSEPDDWRQFDGEIVVSCKQAKGGDCFEVRVDENAWSGKLLPCVINFLRKVCDIRNISMYIDSTQDFNIVSDYLDREIIMNKYLYVKTYVELISR